MDAQYSAKYRRLFSEHVPRFELLEIEPIMKHVGHEPKKPLRVFDVGGNTGGWTIALLRHSGPWIGEVHMFEPMPGNRAKLEEAMSDGLFSGKASIKVCRLPCLTKRDASRFTMRTM